MADAVVATGLAKRFGGFEAVAGVDLRIAAGEIYGFLGPNGAGKTTTIRMLCGILEPTAGEGKVLGFDILRETELIKRHIGYMSQRFSLYEDLTVAENIDFFSGVYGLQGDVKRERAADVVRTAGLEGRTKQYAGTLSGGQKQRLALGCALVHRPQLLFLDEPTAGVDPLSRREFWGWLYDLAADGTTIMVTTHYMDEAEHCNRLGFIYGGKLIAEGRPDDLKDAGISGDLYRLTPASVSAAYAALHHLPGAAVSILGNNIHIAGRALEAEAIKAALGAAGVAYDNLEGAKPSLEDLFVTYIGRGGER